MAQKNTGTPDPIIDLDADQVVEDVKPRDEMVSEPPVAGRASLRLNWPAAGLALVVGAAAGGWIYRDYLQSYFPSNQTVQMMERLATLEAQSGGVATQLAQLDKLGKQLAADLDMLEAKQGETRALTDTLDTSHNELAQRLAALDKAVVEAKNQMSDFASQAASGAGTAQTDPTAISSLQDRIATLEKDVAQLKSGPATATSNSAQLVQAMAALRARVASGARFQPELDAIAPLLPSGDGLEELRRYAGVETPVAKALAIELKNLGRTLPKAGETQEPTKAESDDWLDTIINFLSGLVTIRTIGETDWATVAAASAAFADADDLEQAVELIEKPDAEKPEALKAWLEKAQARIGLNQALQKVEAAALRVAAAKE